MTKCGAAMARSTWPPALALAAMIWARNRVIEVAGQGGVARGGRIADQRGYAEDELIGRGIHQQSISAAIQSQVLRPCARKLRARARSVLHNRPR